MKSLLTLGVACSLHPPVDTHGGVGCIAPSTSRWLLALAACRRTPLALAVAVVSEDGLLELGIGPGQQVCEGWRSLHGLSIH